MYARPQEHMHEYARVDETSMSGKHCLILQAQLQPPSNGAQLNTFCGGCEITEALSEY